MSEIGLRAQIFLLFLDTYNKNFEFGPKNQQVKHSFGLELKNNDKKQSKIGKKWHYPKNIKKIMKRILLNTDFLGQMYCQDQVGMECRHFGKV